jgi:hypothetical protein
MTTSHFEADLFEARQLLELNEHIERVKKLKYHSHLKYLKVSRELKNILFKIKAETQLSSATPSNSHEFANKTIKENYSDILNTHASQNLEHLQVRSFFSFTRSR